jgi:NADH-quinone oxidoreductase subunit L
MPITYWTCLVGTLALTGMPFLSGYYSKDTIIEAAAHVAHVADRADAWSWWIANYAYWAVLLGVFVTAFYSFRLLYLTFHGPERFHDPVPDHYVAPEADSTEHEQAIAHAHDAHDGHDAAGDAGHGHDDHGHGGAHTPHESPPVVTIPLVLLAIPSLLVGLLTVGPMLFGKDFGGAPVANPFFEGAISVLEAPGGDPTLWSEAQKHALEAHGAMAELSGEYDGAVAMGLHFWHSPPFWLALAGFFLATCLYLWFPRFRLKLREWPPFAFARGVLENKYGFDDLWIGVFAKGGVDIGKFAAKRGDGTIIDGIFVDGSAWLVDRTASLLRRLQSGYLYHYAFAMILGLIALLAVLARR